MSEVPLYRPALTGADCILPLAFSQTNQGFQRVLAPYRIAGVISAP